MQAYTSIVARDDLDRQPPDPRGFHRASAAARTGPARPAAGWVRSVFGRWRAGRSAGSSGAKEAGGQERLGVATVAKAGTVARSQHPSRSKDSALNSRWARHMGGESFSVTLRWIARGTIDAGRVRQPTSIGGRTVLEDQEEVTAMRPLFCPRLSRRWAFLALLGALVSVRSSTLLMSRAA
jgi:hypothetical protein